MILRPRYLINTFFTKLEHFIFKSKINPIATLYLNFRCLSFRDACKFPIYVYGKIDFQSLSGQIVIYAPVVYRGMIKIGQRYCRSQGITRLSIDGVLEIGNDVCIHRGSEINIRPNAKLIIGKGSRIYENVMIFCYELISIGKYASITYHTNIFDTDFHYVIDLNTNIIRRHTSPIILGCYNWIGNKTTIKKGTKTLDYTIVAASYSVLCKDYTLDEKEYPILGGAPAHVIGYNKRRIFNEENQKYIDGVFEKIAENYHHNGEINTFCEITEKEY